MHVRARVETSSRVRVRALNEAVQIAAKNDYKRCGSRDFVSEFLHSNAILPY